MYTVLFVTLLGFSAMVALFDWRRGWLLFLICGVLQDPARKLTPGAPVVMTFSAVVVYLAILISSYSVLQEHRREFTRRFGRLSTVGAVFLFILLLAAINGIVSYGIEYWKVPMLSLFTYLSPLPAVLLGYAYVQREEHLYKFFTFYAIVTSVMLVGAMLEYLRFHHPSLGLVAQPGDYIRHLTGIQIRMLSGFYRAPDIMAWHAATLTSIGAAMLLRAGFSKRAWPWIAATAWGFLMCLMSGRRKATYYVAVFTAVFLWRYFRRMQMRQTIMVVVTLAILAGVVQRLSSGEETSVYTRGATASQGELLQRVEGGVRDTINQYGFMGAGLGAATQGVYHLLPSTKQGLGWQEGGLGKLAVELGIPGLFVVATLAYVLFMMLLRLTSIPDVPGSSQLLRVALFALLCANIANFLGSAQAYTDPVLTLVTAFFVGALFATATLDERLAAAGESAEGSTQEPSRVLPAPSALPAAP
jgi:hypothetical protein